MDYYSRNEVSNSNLSWLKNQLSGIEQPDPTEAYKFGNLIDHMITEPEKVDYYAFTCNGVKHMKEDFEIAEKMKRAFFQDDLCRNMLKNSETQKVMIMQDMLFRFSGIEFALDVRCKWDIWMEGLGWGADIKSTSAETQAQFEAACKHFDYDRQRAWYMNIAGSLQDMIIGISKKNFKIFKLPVIIDTPFHKAGVEKYSELAFEWFKRFGNVENIRKAS